MSSAGQPCSLLLDDETKGYRDQLLRVFRVLHRVGHSVGSGREVLQVVVLFHTSTCWMPKTAFMFI